MIEQLIEVFKWFHAHPELSYQEYETTKKIREILEAHKIEILPYNLETGLVAIIRGEKEGPVQAVRCDIDALPILEENDLEYKSVNKGKMHACGHDLHIVTGIGAAIILEQRKAELAGTVKIIFQPAEEAAIGAYKILETDAMNDVEKIWGVHSDPTNPVRTLGIREGAVAAAVDRFAITVKGVGCHGAHPDDGLDPIPVAAAMVQALHNIVSRNLNPFHPRLISVTKLQAGNTWNVIPETAEMEGTIRTMDKADRVFFEKRIREVVENTAKAYGATAELNWQPASPAVMNDGEMADFAEKVAEKCGLKVVPEEQSLGGDDFAFYHENIPGCYIKVGTGVGPTIHQPGFKVDLDAILSAVEYVAELCLS